MGATGLIYALFILVKDLHMNANIGDGNSKRFNDRLEEEAVLPRRVILRNAFAVGCGLLLPVILLGCDSKKDARSTDAGPPGSPDTAADSPAATAPAKATVTKASVQYQPTSRGGQKCSDCANFISGSNTCRVVEGQISPDAWCSLWVQKA